jgi:hypothetical protein
MTTIIRAGNSDGTRRCDATCHNAIGDECNCICRGRYHGKQMQAQEMLTEDVLGDDWRERYGFPAETVVGKVQRRLALEGVDQVVPVTRPKRKSRTKKKPSAPQPRLAL